MKIFASKYVTGSAGALLIALGFNMCSHARPLGDSHADPSGPPSTARGWVTVRDAREQAFSISVPASWKTYGGLFRFSSVDTRLVVDMTSPDGGTDVRVGDATVPGYVVPGPFVRRAPHMAAYASGQAFAAKYGQARFGSGCQELRMTRSQSLAPRFHAAGGGLIRTTGGEAYFTCTRDGVPMTAYVYAETTLIGRGEPGSNWSVSALGSLISPTEQVARAADILRHAGSSLAMNPAWTQAQSQLTGQAVRQIDASTRAILAATDAENARERGMIDSMSNDSFNDVINGVSLKVDPTTGQRYEAPLGTGNPQWVNGNNAIVESALSPGVGFSQLRSVDYR